MRTRRESRDDRENRAQRQEKLGSASDTLPAKTLADQTGASRPTKTNIARTSLQSAHKEARHSREPAGSADPLALKSGTAAEPAKTIVTLRLAARNAAHVMIAGTFSDWSPQRMSRGAQGADREVWRIDLPLEPGQYEYRFIVDGTWIDDPLATAFVPNGFGGRNAVLEVSVSMPRA